MNARLSHRLVAPSIAFGLLLALAGALPLAARTPAQPGSGPPQAAAEVGAALAGSPVGPALLADSTRVLPPPDPLQRDPAALQAWVDQAIANAPDQDDPFAIIDSCVSQDMAGGEGPGDDTPGASLAIALEGRIVYTKGYGVKIPGGDAPVDPETNFRIGSTTKQLTAAALMQLVDAGRVDLQAPITDYLPDVRLAPPYEASDITSHHLLTHSSGIPDQLWVVDPAIDLAAWMDLAMPRYQLHAPPGSFWNYSNPNFNAAGRIVEQVSGRPYYAYMAEEVFARAAMSHTTFYSEEVEARGNYALGVDGNQTLPLDAWDVQGLAPAGTAFSTPSDMVRWASLLMAGGGEVISPESAAAMQERQMPIEIYGWDDYGYGIFVTTMRDSADPEQLITVYDHGGNIPGYSSQLFWVPERQGFAVSILASRIRSLSGAAYCALQVMAGVQPRSGAGLVTTPDQWGPFTGTYAMANTAQWPFTAQVSLVSDTLRLDYSDIGRSPIVGRDFPMVHALADTFLIDENRDGQPDPGLAFTFIRDRDTGERVTYMRDRLLVGHRVGQFPDRVAIEGEACADIDLTAERDMPELSVTAAGLSAWPAERDLLLGQDDPADPTSASFKRDFSLQSDAELFWLAIGGQPGDVLASYLLFDADGDGDFAFPSELAVAGAGIEPHRQLLYATVALPPGDYQLWVHGQQVADPEAGFEILPLVSAGDRLRLEDAPSALSDGQSHTLRVCAEGVEDLDGPALGSVSFRYGQPPRLVRVMVDWSPAPEPPTIHLPWLTKGLDGETLSSGTR